VRPFERFEFLGLFPNQKSKIKIPKSQWLACTGTFIPTARSSRARAAA
jgi:hypothetical protein